VAAMIPNWISFLPSEMFRMDENIFDSEMALIIFDTSNRRQFSMPAGKYILHQQAWKKLSEYSQAPKRDQARVWSEADGLSDKFMG
jgi:hypothetical protein